MILLELKFKKHGPTKDLEIHINSDVFLIFAKDVWEKNALIPRRKQARAIDANILRDRANP